MDGFIECRLCLDEGHIPIFGKKGSENNLCGKIFKYLGQTVEEDGAWPKHVCIDCWNMLDTWNSFYDKVQQTTNALQRKYGDSRVGICIMENRVPAVESESVPESEDPISSTEAVETELEEIIINYAPSELVKYINQSQEEPVDYSSGFEFDISTTVEFLEDEEQLNEKNMLLCSLCDSSFEDTLSVTDHLKSSHKVGRSMVIGY